MSACPQAVAQVALVLFLHHHHLQRPSTWVENSCYSCHTQQKTVSKMNTMHLDYSDIMLFFLVSNISKFKSLNKNLTQCFGVHFDDIAVYAVFLYTGVWFTRILSDEIT